MKNKSAVFTSINRIILGLFIFLFFSGSVFARQNNNRKKQNILWLVAEDIGPYIKAFGDKTANTPNLDRLAAEGVVFSNTFDISGVCAPSRSALITGMYPTSIGTNHMRTSSAFPEIGIPRYSVVLPPEVKMFSEILRADGYYCTNNSKQDYQFEAPSSGWDESSKKAHWRNRAVGQPFFSVFNFDVTHESQIWERKNEPLLVEPARVPLPPYYPDSEIIRRDVARMYSNIMEMDKQVGFILKQLEDDGELENTVIFWYSDNGGPLPRGKREIYDSGMHVPMIIRFPNKTSAGTTNARLISFVDFAPTVLSLAGIKPPSYIQGQPFLRNHQAAPRDYVFAARDRMDSEYDMVRAVRTAEFKYIRNYQPEKPYIQNIKYRKQMDLMNELLRLEKEDKLRGVQKLWFRKTKEHEELYDIINDPHELNNLAANPKYSTRKKELSKELDQWMKVTNDKGFIPEKDLILSFWPGMVQPTTKAPEFVRSQNSVSLTSATAGASISYKILPKSGTKKVVNWALYTKPVVLAKGETLIAIAERIGFKDSAEIAIDNI